MNDFPLAPPQASSIAPEHDILFYAITALATLFTVLVFVMVIFFTLRYREGTKVDRSRPVYENLKLELTWTVIPLILGVIFFFFGARLFVRQRTVPDGAMEIFVIGKQWMWHVQHAASGVRENNTLHVPVGRPVKLTMISQDVIHAFYIPAFRQQMHVVPGRYVNMWFTATKPGRYHLFCGMYCGGQHSEMGGEVVVMEPREFAQWVANGGNSVPAMTMEQTGEKLFNGRLACNNCHGGKSTPRAPSLYGIFRTRRPLADGGTALADENYLRESILRPHNRLTRGYGPTMPAYEGQVSEEEILNLIAYLRNMGMRGNVPASSITGPEAFAADQTRTNGRDPLATYKMGAQTPRTDPTPITRTGSPAVGALSVREGDAAHGKRRGAN